MSDLGLLTCPPVPSAPLLQAPCFRRSDSTSTSSSDDSSDLPPPCALVRSSAVYPVDRGPCTQPPRLGLVKRGHGLVSGVLDRQGRQPKRTRWLQPGPCVMGLFDPPVPSPSAQAVINDRMICADAVGQGIAADARLRRAHSRGQSARSMLLFGDSSLYDFLTCSRQQAVSRSLLYMSSRDFWGLGVDAVGMPVPPSNKVVLVALQRLLFGSCPSRDTAMASSVNGCRQYRDEHFDWNGLSDDGPAFSLSTGVLYVGQECAAWQDLVGGVSLYRPVRLDAVRYFPGLEARYVVQFTFLGASDAGSLTMDLAADEIDSAAGRLLTGVEPVRSCWEISRQYQYQQPTPPPLGVLNIPSTRISSAACAPPFVDDAAVARDASDDEWLRACAPTPGGTCTSPLSISSGGFECPGAPLRVDSFASLSSRAM